MNQLKWNSFTELEDVLNRMKRIFRRYQVELPAAGGWSPPVKISQTGIS